MQLILKEWIGAGNQNIELDSEEIIQLNIDYHVKQLQKYEDNIGKQIDYLNKEIKNDFEKLIKEVVKKRLKINKFFPKLWKDTNVLMIFNEIVNIEVTDHVRKISNTIIDNKNKDKFISDIEKINTQHKNKYNSKTNYKNDINPIIELFEKNGSLIVKTYQFAAEFEINVANNKKIKIKIEPRNLINESNFELMFSTIFNFNQLENISGGKSNTFILLYYIAFLTKLSSILRKGIYREYIELEDNLLFLKERLLIADHLRLNRLNKQKVFCEFSELTPNTTINKVINLTLNYIKRKIFDYNQLNMQLKKIQNTYFQDLELDNNINIKDIKLIRYNRQNIHYKEIMGYCENILQNIGGSFSYDNKYTYSAFYLDMNELFEQFVGKQLVKTFNNIEEVKDSQTELEKSFYRIFCDIKKSDKNSDENKTYSFEFQNTRNYFLDNKNVFKIKPDFLIRDNEDKVIAVLDTKYKRLNENEGLNYGISSSDIYQLITYAYHFKVGKVYLIYPKPRKDFNVNNEELCFNINGININGIEDSKVQIQIMFIDLLSSKI